ncbi:MAG: mandelate racemase/muconate lactonizing enzyme family protein [Candidatus Latescibacterota bacterium]|nr:mandelate racemase/muconate lactonizing enzyme family protein [Candidatus Latescibacterota bacterium]
MKIIEVNVYDLSYPVKKPFANSRSYSRSRAATVVEVRTDSGLIGWGEGSCPPSAADIERFVVGKSPFDYEVIYDDLASGGRNASSACGVEIAVWDLMGKALDQPVWQLLGGRRRSKVLAYASGLFKPEDRDHLKALLEEADRYRDMGFQAVKMKVGFGPGEDERVVSAVREVIGNELGLAIDANCAYDPATAIESGRRCMPYDLMWYEEPVGPLDVSGYGMIKEALPTCRLAGAESVQGSFAFRDLIQGRVLDVIQPDISIAGGFTEMRRIAAMANADYVRVIPHMWGGNVRLAATLHYQATMPDLPKKSIVPFPCYCEYDMTENGLRTELGTQFLMNDGWIDIPEGPGLGVEVNREVLEQYSR